MIVEIRKQRRPQQIASSQGSTKRQLAGRGARRAAICNRAKPAASHSAPHAHRHRRSRYVTAGWRSRAKRRLLVGRRGLECRTGWSGRRGASCLRRFFGASITRPPRATAAGTPPPRTVLSTRKGALSLSFSGANGLVEEKRGWIMGRADLPLSPWPKKNAGGGSIGPSSESLP